ncbi:UbiH/UbiF/VisC/COQ6 family ubiquinone biosynthesis hydroxylase [Paraburkholderia bonniea]|uniref:UbiH/UbiF/VisC/COQ6 family ubiquinone biosynthesis hydroxylase n=1 Tax=Paraburkholderia bonniea TaxID=2152891 RepID=UPI001290E6E1|nr:UbiH/UbiF/VisC/COQ6 family ubiquinone biosynthesis hydroxylase [Paraburkholderia bonniea]WJF89825.1 UbiH/UbiF/VisC/COQ6 family ubiquinone biosynthesis hydroxylase [Paraburkholderia bonniea]WJF93139.1 UbiH/UbiF/VisC/COQ6 family ubiquinone biosynthesis hydroxylase [Paraburkholderia bonniea]
MTSSPLSATASDVASNTAADAAAAPQPSPAAAAPPFDFDVTIVGAGPVGLALAGWLARRSATRTLSVALLDARDPTRAQADPRAIAVSHGSRVLLESLLEPQRWPADACAIHRIHISQHGQFGRALIDRAEHGLSALGYVARYGSIVTALAEAVSPTPTQWFPSTSAHTPAQTPDAVSLPIIRAGTGERMLRTRILVHAEGGLFSEQTASPDTHRDYAQTALVGVVSVSRPQPHVAWERFTATGPLALLPLGGAGQTEFALVWCCAPAEAARRAALADAELLAELGQAFGERMGRFTQIHSRASFPLGLNALDTPVQGRIAAIGNAAQTLHPVAGQGLNLGLRDAYALAEALAQHGATPLALTSFAQRRTLDRRLTIHATDSLARLFTLNYPALGALRGLALTALECAPPVKTALARHMMFGQRR